VNDIAPVRNWLTVPDAAEKLAVTPGRIRKLIEDSSLLAIRRDGVVSIPEVFFKDSEALPELRGTVIVLLDSGFSRDEAMDWLLSEEESLKAAPIDALLAGRKAEVRRVAQALA
jgi:hypothetical protein